MRSTASEAVKWAHKGEHMQKPLTALEAFEKALEFMTIGCYDPRRPGSSIERLPKTVREALKSLTSDDVQRLRPWWK